jgi:hypothetical protein
MNIYISTYILMQYTSLIFTGYDANADRISDLEDELEVISLYLLFHLC